MSVLAGQLYATLILAPVHAFRIATLLAERAIKTICGLLTSRRHLCCLHDMMILIKILIYF